jgi:DNA invertase Pin-like site-specific DNA recombinase
LTVLRRFVASPESRVGTIVVTSLERLSRDADAHEFVRLVKANGIRLVVLEEADDQRL